MIFSLVSLFSCAEEKKKLPAGLLPPAKLTSILADIHIAEAQVENMGLTPDTAKVAFNRLQKEVLKKHGVSKKNFDKTYSYYLNNLNQLDKIYEALVDTLGMREVQFTSKNGKTAPQPKDTVKQIDTVPEKMLPNHARKDSVLGRKLRLSKLRNLK